MHFTKRIWLDREKLGGKKSGHKGGDGIEKKNGETSTPRISHRQGSIYSNLVKCMLT
jgi:hypothetical protein